MKGLIGITLIGLGITVGLYVGIWLCLIGGIVQIIEQIKNPAGIEAMQIAIGIARIVCAGLAGWVSAMILIFPGWAILNK